MKKVTRREFNQVSAAASTALLINPVSSIPQVLQSAATSMPLANPVIVNALNNAAQVMFFDFSYQDLSHLFDKFDRQNLITDKDRYFHEMHKACFALFKGMNRFASHLQTLQTHRAEAEKFIQGYKKIQKELWDKYEHDTDLLKFYDVRDELNKHYGLDEWVFNGQVPHWNIWGPSEYLILEQKIALNLDETPETIVKKLIFGIKQSMSMMDNLNPNTSAEKRKICHEICNQMEDKLASWWPELIKKFFPQIWQGMLQGQHTGIREDIKNTSGNILDEELNRIDYCDYAWTQIHKGNDYY